MAVDRQELAAADQRLRLGPQHRRRRPSTIVESQRRQDRRRNCWCRRTRATSSSYLLKIQQSSRTWSPTAVGGDDIKALRQQVVQTEARSKARLDQQPAGLARHLGRARERSSACSAPTGITGSTCPASRSSSQRSRRPTPVCRSRCPATSLTTATWRRANCCARSSAQARPTTSGSSRSWRTSRCRRATGCSISTRT